MGKLNLRSFYPSALKFGKQFSPLNNSIFGFYSTLSQDLEKLEQSLLEHSATFKWSVEAMNLLKKLQIGLLFLIEKLNLPISLESGNWLDQYMEETVQLLDFCNLLKPAISGLQRFQMIVELAVRNISDGSNTCNLKEEIQKLETETKKLVGSEKLKDGRLKNQVREVKLMIHGSSFAFAGAIFAVRNTTILLSLILVSMIVFPVLIADLGNQENHGNPMLEWSTSLSGLFSRFHESFQEKPKKGSSLILVELEMVESVLVDLKSQVSEEGEVMDMEKFGGSIEMLKEKSKNLKKGLEMFDLVVNEVFEEVIRGRNKVLNIFTDNLI